METAVNAPFIAPPDQHLATLAGYTLTQHATTITLTLVWQGGDEFPASYHVFVHLVDETGQLLAQSDGEPANWTRPTTGWAAGEYITDAHQLALPANPPPRLSLRVGLYDPAADQRLAAETADFVLIPLP